MAVGYYNSPWITTTTNSTTTASSVTWYTIPATGPSAITNQPYGYNAPHVSPGEMIRYLEDTGHRVLQKKYIARMPVPGYLDPHRFDPIPSIPIQYAYALPEKEGEYVMPDGSTLHVDPYGNYKIIDQDAKVTYKANRIREFNPYISASDLLEQFIKEVGHLDGVKQTEILNLPIEAFINWLILQAAKKDGDSLDGLPSVEKALPAPIAALPRCLGCGRFLSRAWAKMRIAFCSQEHMKRYEARQIELRRASRALGSGDASDHSRARASDRTGQGVRRLDAAALLV